MSRVTCHKRRAFAGIFVLAAAALLIQSCSAADDDDKPIIKDADVRVLGREGRILLSRESTPLCAGQLRPITEDPTTAVMTADAAAAALKSSAMKDQPLAKGAEQLREFSYPPDTGNKEDQLSVILRPKRISYGVRLLVNGLTEGPTKDDLAPGETLPGAQPLEFAIQIFPDAAGKAAVLTYADNQRQPSPIDDAARAEAEKRDFAGRTVSARTLVFEGGNGFRIDVARSAPVEWNLQRVGNGWMLRQKLQPDPREPANVGNFILYLGGWRDEGAPEVSSLSLSQPQVPARDFVEGAVRVYASGADVFNLSELAVVAEVACPPKENGEVPLKRLPCFFWEAPSSTPGEGEFRFRFAPEKEGLYGVRIVVVAPAGQVRSEALPLHAGPPASPGFVRTKTGARLFVFDSGEPFFPIGVRLSLPPGKAGANDVRKRFIDLARHGVNTVHLVLQRENFPLELERAGRYDADVAATLDEILRAAQVRGIHIVLGLECGDDIGKNSQRHPYFRELGGPLSASPEFFRDPKARKLYQSRLTYIAARYGAYRSVMSWELVEGLERAWPAIGKDPEDKTLPPGVADLSRRGRRDIQDWAFEAAQFLHGMDQHEHPICVSTGVSLERPWVEIERVDTLDWVLRQQTFPPEGDAASDDYNKDETSVMARWLAASREPGRAHKPLLIEHLLPEKWPESDKDKGLVYSPNVLRLNWLHAAWACGAAGALLAEENSGDALLALNSVSNAYAKAARVELPDELRYVSGDIKAGRPLRYFGRTGRRGFCILIQDPASTWRSASDHRSTGDGEIRLPGLEEGKYVLRWLSASSGELIKQELYDAPAKKVDQPLAPVVLKIPGVSSSVILTAERAASNN